MKRLDTLRELQEKLGAEVFLVGGAVRDLLRRKEPKDVDVLVRNVSPAEFENFLRSKGTLRLVGESFGVYLFQPRDCTDQIEIAFPRKEVSTGSGHRDFLIQCDPQVTIEEDSNRRDFTCNALFLDLKDFPKDGRISRKDLEDKVIDFHGGREHMRKRLVVAVGDPEKRIQEDPLRMLRACVLVARTRYRLEGTTFGGIRQSADLIRTVAPERLRDEFIKIMEADKPSRAFKTMYRLGLLQIIFPELSDCYGVGQNPKHHSYNVFDHLIYATDAACSLTSRLDVRMAALCHDLGKAPTRAIKPGGDGPDDVSFHNHEIVSTNLAYTFFRRLMFPKKFTEEVIKLIRMHQYKYDRQWTDKAVRRFIRKCEIIREDLDNLDEHPQFLVRQADRMGNELKAHLPITRKQQDFQARIIGVFESSTAHSLRDLKVNGNDLRKEFGLPAGPLIGQVISFLFDRVEETPDVNTRNDLLRLAGRFLEETNYGNIGTVTSSARASKSAEG